VKGAEVNATNRDGKTALHYAAGKGHLHVVETLLEHNADLDARYNDKSAADLAKEHGQKEVEEFLRNR
jgi:ankyrin repeat protein